MKSGYITLEVIKMKNVHSNEKDPEIRKDTVSFHDDYQIRQNAHYDLNGKAAPDNNLFWEKKSNPLSSKGN